jgi:hypothetical protein
LKLNDKQNVSINHFENNNNNFNEKNIEENKKVISNTPERRGRKRKNSIQNNIIINHSVGNENTSNFYKSKQAFSNKNDIMNKIDSKPEV